MDTLRVSGKMGAGSIDPATFVTDSAAADTTMATGVKTIKGAVGDDA